MHNKCIDVIHKSFSALNEFMKWKEDFEENSRSSYVLHCAPKCHSDSNYVSYYYYCNRSGKYSSRGKEVRELKIQGSSKIGTHCLAYIRAKKDQDGQIEVEICNYHTHGQQLAHLPLPLSTRETVAAKLADGVTISNILTQFVKSHSMVCLVVNIFCVAKTYIILSTNIILKVYNCTLMIIPVSACLLRI